MKIQRYKQVQELVPHRFFGYNPYIMTDSSETSISTLFDLLSQPARIQILMIIREQPACVCHMMAALGLRQASISQHLMLLRKAGWVKTLRESRNIYYSLADARLVMLIEQAAALAGVSVETLEQLSHRPIPDCPCPQCHPELPPEYSCKSIPKIKVRN